MKFGKKYQLGFMYAGRKVLKQTLPGNRIVNFGTAKELKVEVPATAKQPAFTRTIPAATVADAEKAYEMGVKFIEIQPGGKESTA